ncbi:hypothetical protein Cgig2_012066 [Carnegiea gigantea]|uniref:Uncharacterized protein n=1 Tax=Carnegiea gigantea TaxID=171969 RepID=A0A9Q1QNG3_9CARY|nr:hypothetical protein Cgig2_012066 [Carnegiea gigantea]
MENWNVIVEGELAAFLAFWLSHFVLPHGKEVIRPETFVMAPLMTSRQRISLALTILGYIYHGLGEAAYQPGHPGTTNTIFPSHYSYFPSLYYRRQMVTVLVTFLVLFIMLGYLAVNLHYHKLDTFLGIRDIFLSELALIVRTLVINGRDVIDMGSPDEDFKFLLSIWSSVLPQQGLMDQAYAELQRRDTMAKFYVPPSYYEGETVVPRRNLWYHPLKKEKPSALRSMIDIFNLSTIEICWLSSKIEEIFGIVETAAKMKELVDVNRVKALSDQDLTCSSKIAYIEGQINNLSSEASKFKKKKAEQVKVDLVEAGFSKLQDLEKEKEKDRLKNLIGFVISFNNV